MSASLWKVCCICHDCNVCWDTYSERCPYCGEEPVIGLCETVSVAVWWKPWTWGKERVLGWKPKKPSGGRPTGIH